VNGAVVTEGCRGIKTKKEIACMDYANRLTKKAYKTAFSRLRAGMSPEALGREVSSAHQNLGVKGGGWPSFGPNSAFPHGSSRERNLESGDVVLIDGGCGVHGYRSDVTRTIVYGQATDKQKRVWDTVKKAQDSAYKAIRPGVPCEEIDRVARRVIEEAGFGAGYAHFTHRLGHGIGLDGHEYPYLVKGNTLRLQPGMTFSNEPGIYIPGEFGIRIEDCFVVTDGGYRVLGGMESLAIDRPFAET
jgi:Xaa-Pro dipeptidase